MTKKPKLSVWNKKNSKIDSVKILKAQKKPKPDKPQDLESSSSPMAQFVKKFDDAIRNACK